MNLGDILRQTVSTFRAHKMRNILTMFAIIWGIASVILLVGASLLTLSLITFTAGMYPAQRAAEMMPIDSSRYE